jgi:hypothetical protein
MDSAKPSVPSSRSGCEYVECIKIKESIKQIAVVFFI